LKPDGILLIQTPCYPEARTREEMENHRDPFLSLLIPIEHTYLFSRQSVQMLLTDIGAPYVQFEPAIFSHYDMFLAAGKMPLPKISAETSLNLLAGKPLGRLVRALLDLRTQFEGLDSRYKESEADRAARLQLLEEAGKRLAALEADGTARLENIWKLEKSLAEANLFLAARQEVAELKDQLLTEMRRSRDDAAARIADLTEQKAAQEKEIDTYARELLELKNAQAELTASGVTLQQRVEAATSALAAELAHLQQLHGLLSTSNAQGPQPEEPELGLEDGLSRLAGDIRELHSAITKQLWEAKVREERLKAQNGDLQSQLGAAHAVLDRLPNSLIVRLLQKVSLWTWVQARPESKSTTHVPVPINRGSKKLKRICVDLTPVLPGGDNGGAKILCLELIQELSRQEPDCEFILLTCAKSHDELAHLDRRNVRRMCVTGAAQPAGEKGLSIRRRLRTLGARLPKPLLRRLANLYQDVAEGLQNKSTLVGDLGADLLFCPFTAPFFSDARVPVVAVVLDIQYLHYPEFFSAQEREEGDRNFRRACQVASRIICISEYVRQSVLKAADISPSRVDTVHIALQHRLEKLPAGGTDSVLGRYGLHSGRYLLYPANFWLHKNHELLITAFGMHQSKTPGSDLKLVFTGAPGAHMDYLKDACSKMQLGGKVVFAGYLPDEEFTVLLRCCLALIFPSLYEGFGIPVWEAMAAGKPVLCSNVTSLPEICGDAALLFDPRKPDEIAAAIDRIETEPRLVYQLSEKARQHVASAPNGSVMAARYMEIFRTAVGDPAGTTTGIHGLYPDRWTDKRVLVTFPASDSERTLVMRVSAGDWIPVESTSVQILPAVNGDTKVHRIGRGQMSSISRSLPKEGGFLELVCDNIFRPSAYLPTDDMRNLGCRVESAQIICPNGSIDLLEENNVT
jgi:glycosyltransferase involved in cell wall biosynthesis